MKMSRKESQAISIEPEPGWKQVEAKEKGEGKADESRKAIEIARVTATGSSTVVERAARGRITDEKVSALKPTMKDGKGTATSNCDKKP